MSIYIRPSKFQSQDYRSLNFSGRWQHHFINEYVRLLHLNGVDSTEEILANAKEEHIPGHLYKFCPPSLYSYINLEANQLFLSSPRYFNDPFDSYMCIQTGSFEKHFIIQELQNRKLISKDNIQTPHKITYNERWSIQHDFEKKSNLLNEIFEHKSKELKDIITGIRIRAYGERIKKMNSLRNNSFKITCFSNFNDELELGSNTTMWSHYADNHKGFCVRYKLDFTDYKYKNTVLCGLFPVIYSSRVPMISTTELVKLQYNQNKLVLNQSVYRASLKALITKSKFWSYEKEWRLIINEENSPLISSELFPFLKIDKVYLGCRIEAGIKMQLATFAEKHSIDILQATQEDDKFNLSFTDASVKKIKEDEFFTKLRRIGRDDLAKLTKLTNEYPLTP